jgi:hypothetical protein
MPIRDQERLPAAPAVLHAATIRTMVDAMFRDQVRNALGEVIQFILAWKQVRSLRVAGTEPHRIVTGYNDAAGGVPGLMANVENAIDAVRLSSNIAWLVTPRELGRIIDAWQAAWGGGPAPAANVCPTSDTTFLRYLRTYVRAHNLSTWVPRTHFDGFHEGKVKLHLARYEQVQLVTGGGADDMAGVRRLLKLFAAGAHFVFIHSTRDLGGGGIPSFYDQVYGGGLATRTARMNSHYTQTFVSNLNAGLYYPDFVTEETAPANHCPFITSLLIGRTSWGLGGNAHNTFMQLEGWPATGWTGAGGRHGKDYKTHVATKWNISTFGASLYSEKRGTTVFLAPPGWNPQPGPQIMAPYDGANQAQSWLDRDLVR